MKRLHYTFLTLTILWMVVIFIFSSQTGDTSSNTSGTIVNFIVSIFVPDFDGYNATKQQDILDIITLIIRKGARLKRKIYGLASLIFTCLYAISDELHQGFVADRSPAVLDVVVDTCGGLAGILVACVCTSLYIHSIPKKIKGSKNP